MFTEADIPALLAELTLEEKASLLSGQDFWHSQAIERVDIPAMMMTDGPHGLRKQAGAADHVGVNASVPATCFPTAAGLASTWDPTLLRRLGETFGAEIKANNVGVILGPGVNIKRSPLCGRNFEYLSEDPLLAGRIAAGITRGVQSHPGRGVTVKHFAFNNQETNRLNSNSNLSKRAARDLYLRSFEIVVRESQPHGLMTSYNLVNGVHTSESRELLEDILRHEWGYEGLVMTDWVVDAMARTDQTHPRAQAGATVAAGNELFMPGCEEDRQNVLAALRGEVEGVGLSRERLRQQAARVVRMAHRLGDVAPAPEV